MRIIKTIDDGDCFFDTLATYGWAYHYAPLENPHQQLRQILVDYMEENRGDIAPYISVNENKGETVDGMIESLREDMVWNNDMGDLVSQIAANAFRVNIFIYDVDPPEIRRIRANQIDYHGPPIHMLRINDGHYQLLLPQEDAPHIIASYASAQKKKKKSNMTKKAHPPNHINQLSHALSKVALSKVTNAKNHTHKNHKNHANQKNQQLLKNREQLQEYEKITVVRLHKVLRSFGMSEEDIQTSILSLPKKEQKTAYYDHYMSLLS